MSKHHIVAKAKKRHRRNKQVWWRETRDRMIKELGLDENLSAEKLRLRAVKRAKEARDDKSGG